MIHSLANIEQWAIDLSWDVMGRFSTFKINEKPLPMEFFDDFIKVANDEAKVRSKYLYFWHQVLAWSESYVLNKNSLFAIDDFSIPVLDSAIPSNLSLILVTPDKRVPKFRHRKFFRPKSVLFSVHRNSVQFFMIFHGYGQKMLYFSRHFSVFFFSILQCWTNV